MRIYTIINLSSARALRPYQTAFHYANLIRPCSVPLVLLRRTSCFWLYIELAAFAAAFDDADDDDDDDDAMRGMSCKHPVSLKPSVRAAYWLGQQVVCACSDCPVAWLALCCSLSASARASSMCWTKCPPNQCRLRTARAEKFAVGSGAQVGCIDLQIGRPSYTPS